MTGSRVPGATERIIAGRRLHLDARTVVEGAIGIRGGRVAWVHAERGLDVGTCWPGVPCLHAGDADVIPGLVDGHVHLRDPGQTHKEDVGSGTSAAAAGGVTTVVAQPNTVPEIADLDALGIVHERIRRSAVVDVGVAARLPWRDGPMARDLAQAGVCIFDVTFAGVPSHELPVALEMVAALDVPLGIYAEDPDVVRHNRSVVGGLAGARGDARVLSPFAEASACQRILSWLTEVPATVLFRQVSSQSALELLLDARRSGRYPPFGIEVTPHHVMLDASRVEEVGERARIWPPLRSRSDVEFAWHALRSGGVDLVGSDHSPHALDEKDRSADHPDGGPPPGFPGLETALSALLTGPRSKDRGLQLGRVIEVYAEGPARWLGLSDRKGHLHVGADADAVLVDVSADRTIDAGAQWTKSKTSPFAGVTLRGRVVATVARGEVVYRDETVTGSGGRGAVLLRRGIGVH
jgi:dihydroorotase (multifunctional complex type)